MKIDTRETASRHSAIPVAQRASSGPDGEAVTTPNFTGLPDSLKAGVEGLSGLSLNDVHVHYNSPKPAQLQALAYAQGTDIHVAPGQERHLPHEAWHVVQQKQGRVRATIHGPNVNTDPSLEAEAERVGGQAIATQHMFHGTGSRLQSGFTPRLSPGNTRSSTPVIQRFSDEDVRRKAYELWERKGSPQNQSPEERQQDYLEAKRQLRAYEIWQGRNSPQNQMPQERESDYLQAAREVEESHRLMQIVMGRGHDLETETQRGAYSLWEQRGRPQNQTQGEMQQDYLTARTNILNSMRLGLSTEEFEYAGLRDHILNIRDAYLRGDYQAANGMLFNNTLARRFGLRVVIVPTKRNLNYCGIQYTNFTRNNMIATYVNAARQDAMAYADGNMNLPVYRPWQNWNNPENYFDHPDLARLVIPIYLEEWMHQLQRKFRRFRGITGDTGAYLSRHTEDFRQHSINTKTLGESADSRMNYNEVDILATFEDWGFDIHALGTIGNFYVGRREFWDWRHPHH